jgi:Immunity protein 52
MPKAKTTHYKNYELHSHWYSRLQTAQECAVALVNFLKSLESLGTPFINWDYLNTKDKSEAIPFDVDEVRKRLLLPGNGARRGVKPEETMPVMGFNSLLFSEGKAGERVTLSMTCGISEESRPGNKCRIKFPTKGEIATQVLQLEVLKQLLKLVVQAWNPDWAVIDYFDPSDQQKNPNRIPVYWFVYLSESRGQIPLLREPSCVERIEGYGSYAIVTPEPFNRDRLEHLAIANQVKTILDEVGLLTKQLLR